MFKTGRNRWFTDGLRIVLCAVIIIAIIVGFAALERVTLPPVPGKTNVNLLSESLKGSGTQSDPFRIDTVEALVTFRDAVNYGESFLGKYVVQTEDLDLDGITSWDPIGIYASGTYFFGTYDGNGHTIRNLHIVNGLHNGLNIDGGHNGFFGSLFGVVKNLGIESGEIEGNYVGALASYGYGFAKLHNCYNKASVHGTVRAGGLVDEFYGDISYCWNVGDLSCDSQNIGGITSYRAKSLSNCVSVGYPAISEIFSGKADHVTELRREEVVAKIDELYYDALYLEYSGHVTEQGIQLFGIRDGELAFVPEGFMPDSYRQRHLPFLFANCGVPALLGIGAIVFAVMALGLGAWRKKDSAPSKAQQADTHGVAVKRSGVNIKAVVLVVCFTLIFYVVTNQVLMIKRDDGAYLMRAYHEQPKDTVDVLMVGSSRTGMNLDCEELWKNHGISGYSLWSGGQSMISTYYYLEEALEVSRPKVIVYDVQALLGLPYDSSEVINYQDTYGLVNLKRRIQSIRTTVPQRNWLLDFMGFGIYHNRYNELTQEDFRRCAWTGLNAMTKGSTFRVGAMPVQQYGNVKPKDYQLPIDKEYESYFREAIKMCESRGIPLCLVLTPSCQANSDQPHINYIESIANEYGLSLLNFNTMADELGITANDFWFDGNHITTNASRKISAYLAERLVDQYGLEDHRGDDRFRSWDDFMHYQQNVYIPQIEEPLEYLSELVRDDKTVLFVRWQVGAEDEQLAVLLDEAKAAGLDIGIPDAMAGGYWFSGKDGDALGGVLMGPVTFALDDHSLSIDPYGSGTIQYDGRDILALTPGLFCVVYDSYNAGSIVDARQLTL